MSLYFDRREKEETKAGSQMIPHNIQQKLEEMAEKFSDKINGYENPDAYVYARKGHSQGAQDLWQILTEGAMEFDEEPFLAWLGKNGKPLRLQDCARWQFNQLQPKMMAMEAEIQRLKAELDLERYGPPKIHHGGERG